MANPSNFNLEHIQLFNKKLVFLVKSEHWVKFYNLLSADSDFTSALSTARSKESDPMERKKATSYIEREYMIFIDKDDGGDEDELFSFQPAKFPKLAQPAAEAKVDADDIAMEEAQQVFTDSELNRIFKTHFQQYCLTFVANFLHPVKPVIERLANEESGHRYLLLQKQNSHFPHQMESKFQLESPKHIADDEDIKKLISASRHRELKMQQRRLDDAIEIKLRSIEKLKQDLTKENVDGRAKVLNKVEHCLSQYFKSRFDPITPANTKRIEEFVRTKAEGYWNTQFSERVAKVRMDMVLQDEEDNSRKVEKWKEQKAIKEKESLVKNSVSDQKMDALKEDFTKDMSKMVATELALQLSKLGISASNSASKSRHPRSHSRSRSHSRERGRSRSRSQSHSRSRSRSRSNSYSRKSKKKSFGNFRSRSSSRDRSHSRSNSNSSKSKSKSKSVSFDVDSDRDRDNRNNHNNRRQGKGHGHRGGHKSGRRSGPSHQ